MYAGDHNRKVTLVEHGFRLPSALDNRPLKFDEWEERINQVIFVSATPGPYELEKTGGEVVEQVIRPTGLLDPEIEVAPARGQVPHLLEQIRQRAAVGERVLVTTLTKRLAEDLAAYFGKQDVRCKWLHSELDAFERVELLRDLRQGQFDVLVGVNLLARGARPARGLAGGHPRRRQGGLPAERDLADADHRPLGPQRQRQGDPLRRQGDRLDAAGDRGDPPPPRSCRRSTTAEHGITPETIRKSIRAGIEAEAAAHARVERRRGPRRRDRSTSPRSI